jgi:hypothetical protein
MSEQAEIEKRDASVACPAVFHAGRPTPSTVKPARADTVPLRARPLRPDVQKFHPPSPFSHLEQSLPVQYRSLPLARNLQSHCNNHQ